MELSSNELREKKGKRNLKPLYEYRPEEIVTCKQKKEGRTMKPLKILSTCGRLRRREGELPKQQNYP